MKVIVFSATVCALTSAYGANINLDYVLNPSQFGIDAAEFGDALSVSGQRIAVHQRTGWGIVHVFEGSRETGFIKKLTINSPDPTDHPTFGQSLGFRGDLLYAGSPETSRAGSHDGTAYLFNLNGGLLKEKWTESPHMEGYFGMVGGIADDVLYVGQADNADWRTRSGLFVYSLNPSGVRTLIGSMIQPETAIQTWPVVANRNQIFARFLRLNSSDHKIVVFDVQRDASGAAVGIRTNTVISDPGLYDGSMFSMAQSEDLLAYGNPTYSNGGVSSGAVFVYKRSGDNWSRTATLYPPSLQDGAAFGAALQFSAGKLVVGCPGFNALGSKRGCVYVYDLSLDSFPHAVEQFQPATYAIGREEVFGAVLAPTTAGVIVSSSGGFNYSGARLPDTLRNAKGALYFLSFDGTFCGPTAAKATATVVNGFVVEIELVDSGCGYAEAPFVTISGGGGRNATATATVSNGRVTRITVDNAGSGYGTPTTVTIASPPFAPWLEISVSKIKIKQHVVLGRKYVLEASTDLQLWAPLGPPFTAESEEVTQELDVDGTNRHFRIRELP